MSFLADDLRASSTRQRRAVLERKQKARSRLQSPRYPTASSTEGLQEEPELVTTRPESDDSVIKHKPRTIHNHSAYNSDGPNLNQQQGARCAEILLRSSGDRTKKSSGLAAWVGFPS
ncbi:hypothetical protein BJX68DRAFT_172694 [Aspergillus pseudodeflectus]|uniref:Uncharacterized protein n=1 Tax=Aspergillus pseudodeflectus TaxID=176178 RepID=A0ABR4JNW9_9EURO